MPFIGLPRFIASLTSRALGIGWGSNSRSTIRALIPARDPARITVHDVLTCMIDRGTPLPYSAKNLGTDTVVEHLLADLEEGIQERWGNIGLTEILDEQDRRDDQEILPFAQTTISRIPSEELERRT